MPNNLAPIVLFVYNRPWHTKQTLEALSANFLADQSELIIFADGQPPNASENDNRKILEVKEIIKEKQWCKRVTIIESESNIGLAQSIIHGVTKIVNQYGKIIVLEDDIITSNGFLKYMNDALEIYKDEESVMHLSGYMFPVRKKLPSTFFYNTASCWGWGTWERAWKYFDNDARKLYSILYQKNLVFEFNIYNSYPFISQLENNITGKISTWAIKWYASFFLKKGYALHPYPSLTNNIGHDNSGEHCSYNNSFTWSNLGENIIVKKIPIIESKKARLAMKEYNRKLFKKEQPILSKYLNKIKHIVKLLICFKTPSNHSSIIDIKSRGIVINEINRIKKLPRFIEGIFEVPCFKIRFVDSASFLFMYNEIFNKEIYKFCAESTHPYIIDCGANIGLSVIYFKKLYPDAEIIAFEPDPRVFNVLKENTESMRLEKVSLINKALWNEETKIEFYSEGADGGRIAIDSDNTIKVSIETVRLKDFIINKKVDFLKIDIEGAETNVLIDSREVLQNVKYLFVEYHSFLNQRQTLNELLSILTENNFRYYIYHIGITSEYPYLNISNSLSMDGQLNIFAIRT
jgi:FkbM family methyltransferase